MGKQNRTIDRDSEPLDMLLHWSSMHSLARNMSGCSDLCFLRFFRLLYKKDRRFLVLFLRKRKNGLDGKHYQYARDAFGKIGIEI